MIHLQHPAVLLLLVPLALIALWLAHRGRPDAVAHSSTDLVRAVAKTRRTRWGRLLPAMRWLGAALIIVGLARPYLENHKAQLHASGVDVMLALDVSGSMQARDMATAGSANGQDVESRLDAAKEVVSRFVKERGSDRVGLVAFAGESYLASPLTLDHDWVQQSLDRLESSTKSGLSDGTAIGSAIATSVRRLDAQDAKSKIVILLTDGQNNAGKVAPSAAAEAAKALGVKVYTIGVGSKGEALVPVTNERGRQELVMAKVDVDEPSLRQVADTTGGKFYRAIDTTSLRRVYDEIDRLEKTTRGISSFTQRSERFAWFAGPGLLLLAGSLALSATRFRRVP
ncbi:MAG: Mg-chelatase subunit ChlD [Myxococcaceae bacterium]|jgi:Ca-activated chloride channel family protein|nr:Mg-chelatase subunit ChlD [Myxococcaceae bacterium]